MSRVGLLFVYGVIWDLVWQLWLGVYRLEFHYGLSSGYGRDQVRTGEYIREGDFRSGGGVTGGGKGLTLFRATRYGDCMTGRLPGNGSN